MNENIRIGTMVKGNRHTLEYIRQIIPYGFETIQLHFWNGLHDIDLSGLAAELRELLQDTNITVSALGIFGNPLSMDENGREFRDAWKTCIEHAEEFGTDLVTGFTGRVENTPIEDSLDQFRKVFTPLADAADRRNVRIAFENCPMEGSWQTGKWNIAHNPAAWELMFSALPAEHIGLEWEPAHQIVQLIDPLPQLKQWANRIFHVHGKDASVNWELVRRSGIYGPENWVEQRFPGLGDTDWRQIFSELRRIDYSGSVDIEGYHDPVFRKELEMTGQLNALKYLQTCRGQYVPKVQLAKKS